MFVVEDAIHITPLPELPHDAPRNIQAKRKRALGFRHYVAEETQATCGTCEYLFRVSICGKLVRKCALISINYKTYGMDTDLNSSCNAHIYKQGPDKVVLLDGLKNEV